MSETKYTFWTPDETQLIYLQVKSIILKNSNFYQSMKYLGPLLPNRTSVAILAKLQSIRNKLMRDSMLFLITPEGKNTRKANV
jgi:hypothetical protein